MKRKILMLILIVLLISGCSKENLEPLQALQLLKSMNSYSCDLQININNAKQNQVITAVQQYLKNVGCRMDVDKEFIYIFKKDNIYVKDLENGISYSLGSSEDGIYSLSVVEECLKLIYTDEDVKYTKISGNEYMIFNFQIPYNNQNIQKGAFYVDVKQGLPFKLCLYDSLGKETVEVNYTNFRLDSKLKSTLFEIK